MSYQKRLLEIVKLWKINLSPEYRGFRCADCQKYIHKAWHHYLNYSGFKNPVHLCKACQKKFGSTIGIKYQFFKCDKCSKNMFKSFHIWSKEGKSLLETHYCRRCWKERIR